MRSSANRWFSTLVPIHTCSGHGPFHGAISAMFSGRLVRSCHRSQGVSSMTSHSRSRGSATSGWSSNTSAMDAQNTLAGTPAFSASRFHLRGLAQLASDSIRRGPLRRQMSWPYLLAWVSA
jgi:hypothetical protein